MNTKRTRAERAFGLIGPVISKLEASYGVQSVLRAIQQQTGWNDGELVDMAADLGLPTTTEEMTEFLALGQEGPMHTEFYYRWAAAVTDAQSQWSVTQAGRAALGHRDVAE